MCRYCPSRSIMTYLGRKIKFIRYKKPLEGYKDSFHFFHLGPIYQRYNTFHLHNQARKKPIVSHIRSRTKISSKLLLRLLHNQHLFFLFCFSFLHLKLVAQQSPIKSMLLKHPRRSRLQPQILTRFQK